MGSFSILSTELRTLIQCQTKHIEAASIIFREWTVLNILVTLPLVCMNCLMTDLVRVWFSSNLVQIMFFRFAKLSSLSLAEDRSIPSGQNLTYSIETFQGTVFIQKRELVVSSLDILSLSTLLSLGESTLDLSILLERSMILLIMSTLTLYSFLVLVSYQSLLILSRESILPDLSSLQTLSYYRVFNYLTIFPEKNPKESQSSLFLNNSKYYSLLLRYSIVYGLSSLRMSFLLLSIYSSPMTPELTPSLRN